MSLRITDLAKRYGDNTVFKGVSLTVAAGEFVAIVGESTGTRARCNYKASCSTAWTKPRVPACAGATWVLCFRLFTYCRI